MAIAADPFKLPEEWAKTMAATTICGPDQIRQMWDTIKWRLQGHQDLMPIEERKAMIERACFYGPQLGCSAAYFMDTEWRVKDSI